MNFSENGAPTAASPTAETETEAEAAASAAADASTAAASSPADEKDAKPVDLLSVVKSAVEQKDEDDAAPSAAAGEGEAQPGAEAEAKPGEGEAAADAEADADAKLPFHKHPRWQEVLAERDAYKDDAERFRQIEGFCEQHGLQPSEVAEGFDIMAKLKSGDPERLNEAREWFAIRLQALDTTLGIELPDDLRERVETGALDEEAAQELARVRASERLRTAKTEQQQADEAEQRQRSERVAVAEAMATAVDEWDKQQRQSDPDYAKKADLIEAQCRAIVQRTGRPPANAEQAVELCKTALKEVDARLKSLLPTPKPVRRDPAGSSAATVHEPKTLREAIAAAASRG